MEWSDEAVVLSVRGHGETAAVVEMLTRKHGRHAGLVHGGRSRKMRPVLQPGNQVLAVWKARLSEHLGHVSVELQRGFAASAMENPAALAALSSMCTLTHLLPERDPHPNLYEITLFVLQFLDEPDLWPPLYVRWELALLEELGYGLDLAACAATGVREELAYVSPKSGRAVSREAGLPYHERMLTLPVFLTRGRPTGPNAIVTAQDIAAGLALTGHFLADRVYALRHEPVPEARARAAELMVRQSGR